MSHGADVSFAVLSWLAKAPCCTVTSSKTQRLCKALSQVRWSGIRLILVAECRREMASEPLPRAWCPRPPVPLRSVILPQSPQEPHSALPSPECHCRRSAQRQAVEGTGEHVRSKFLFREKVQVTKKSRERVSCVSSPPGRYRLGRTQQ